jgi:hypothetical protein
MVGLNNPRTQIAIPAQGIQELKGTLTNLIEEFGNEDDRGNHQNSCFMRYLDRSIR